MPNPPRLTPTISASQSAVKPESSREGDIADYLADADRDGGHLPVQPAGQQAVKGREGALCFPQK